MFTKTTLAFAIIVGTASVALAAPAHHKVARASSDPVQAARHIPGDAYGQVSSGRPLSPGNAYDSLSGSRHPYANPDRDFFGENAGGKIY